MRKGGIGAVESGRANGSDRGDGKVNRDGDRDADHMLGFECRFGKSASTRSPTLYISGLSSLSHFAWYQRIYAPAQKHSDPSLSHRVPTGYIHPLQHPNPLPPQPSKLNHRTPSTRQNSATSLTPTILGFPHLHRAAPIPDIGGLLHCPSHSLRRKGRIARCSLRKKCHSHGTCRVIVSIGPGRVRPPRTSCTMAQSGA
jgi:hypothetical protein